MMLRIIATAMLLAFTTLPTMAQNKVVVVPLGSQAAKPSAVDEVALGGGEVSTGGNLSNNWGVPMTADNNSTGTYQIIVPGLRPGCDGETPTFFANAGGPAFVFSSGSFTNCLSGDVTLTIIQRNFENAPSNGRFNFHLIAHNGFPSSLSSTNRIFFGVNKSQSKLTISSPTECMFDAQSGVETCK